MQDLEKLSKEGVSLGIRFAIGRLWILLEGNSKIGASFQDHSIKDALQTFQKYYEIKVPNLSSLEVNEYILKTLEKGKKIEESIFQTELLLGYLGELGDYLVSLKIQDEEMKKLNGKNKSSKINPLICEGRSKESFEKAYKNFYDNL